MTDGTLEPVLPTSFAAEGVLERTHLQAALRENISLLGEDLLVVAEEFGAFSDANRRIDLLCIDREARPVVVELKRTNDGGHMELQALRYAAMVSAMTFDDLVSIFEKHSVGMTCRPRSDGRDLLRSSVTTARRLGRPAAAREVRCCERGQALTAGYGPIGASIGWATRIASKPRTASSSRSCTRSTQGGTAAQA